MSAIATAAPCAMEVRSSEARIRPNGLMESALEEQRFEQRRKKKERDQAEERCAGRKSERLYDHQRVNAEDDKAKDSANAPPRHDIGLGRKLDDRERHD